jgi:hypothetical protein
MGGGVPMQDRKPGADLGAIAYRAMILHAFVHSEELRLYPWIRDGRLDDAIFREVSQIPMTWMAAGRQNLQPYDAEELLRRIAASATQSGNE